MAQRTSPKEERFCVEYVRNGGKKKNAAISAGSSDISAPNDAYRMLQKPHILSKIEELTRAKMASLGPGLLVSMVRLAESANSEKVRFDALSSLLDRAGYQAIVTTVKLDSTAPSDVGALRKRAAELISSLGSNGDEQVSTLVPHEEAVVDVEPEDVVVSLGAKGVSSVYTGVPDILVKDSEPLVR